MNRAAFEQIIETQVIDKIRDLLVRKGAEYASDDDRLANFKRQAEKQGQTVLEVWKQYYAKHADSLDSYFTRVLKSATRLALDDLATRDRVNHEMQDVEHFLQTRNKALLDAMNAVDAQLSEPIEGRLLDIMVYCAICIALLDEVRAGEA